MITGLGTLATPLGLRTAAQLQDQRQSRLRLTNPPRAQPASAAPADAKQHGQQQQTAQAAPQAAAAPVAAAMQHGACASLAPLSGDAASTDSAAVGASTDADPACPPGDVGDPHPEGVEAAAAAAVAPADRAQGGKKSVQTKLSFFAPRVACGAGAVPAEVGDAKPADGQPTPAAQPPHGPPPPAVGVVDAGAGAEAGGLALHSDQLDTVLPPPAPASEAPIGPIDLTASGDAGGATPLATSLAAAVFGEAIAGGALPALPQAQAQTQAPGAPAVPPRDDAAADEQEDQGASPARKRRRGAGVGTDAAASAGRGRGGSARGRGRGRGRGRRGGAAGVSSEEDDGGPPSPVAVLSDADEDFVPPAGGQAGSPARGRGRGRGARGRGRAAQPAGRGGARLQGRGAAGAAAAVAGGAPAALLGEQGERGQLGDPQEEAGTAGAGAAAADASAPQLAGADQGGEVADGRVGGGLQARGAAGATAEAAGAGAGRPAGPVNEMFLSVAERKRRHKERQQAEAESRARAEEVAREAAEQAAREKEERQRDKGERQRARKQPKQQGQRPGAKQEDGVGLESIDPSSSPKAAAAAVATGVALAAAAAAGGPPPPSHPFFMSRKRAEPPAGGDAGGAVKRPAVAAGCGGSTLHLSMALAPVHIRQLDPAAACGSSGQPALGAQGVAEGPGAGARGQQEPAGACPAVHFAFVRRPEQRAHQPPGSAAGGASGARAALAGSNSVHAAVGAADVPVVLEELADLLVAAQAGGGGDGASEHEAELLDLPTRADILAQLVAELHTQRRRHTAAAAGPSGEAVGGACGAGAAGAAPAVLAGTPGAEGGGGALREQLWSAALQPSCADEVCGNAEQAGRIRQWLCQWREVIQQEGQRGGEAGGAKAAARPRRRCASPDSYGSGSASDDDWDNASAGGTADSDQRGSGRGAEHKGLPTVLLLRGPPGCGKTAAAYAVAAELGFRVLEVNPTADRSGPQLLRMVGEATQSRRLVHRSAGQAGAAGGWMAQPQQQAAAGEGGGALDESSPEPDSSPEPVKRRKAGGGRGGGRGGAAEAANAATTHAAAAHLFGHRAAPGAANNTFPAAPGGGADGEAAAAGPGGGGTGGGGRNGGGGGSATLMLFDEVDVLPDEDRGFMAALVSIIQESKRPIILTAGLSPLPPPLRNLSLQELHFQPPTQAQMLRAVALACAAAVDHHAPRRPQGPTAEVVDLSGSAGVGGPPRADGGGGGGGAGVGVQRADGAGAGGSGTAGCTGGAAAPPPPLLLPPLQRIVRRCGGDLRRALLAAQFWVGGGGGGGAAAGPWAARHWGPLGQGAEQEDLPMGEGDGSGSSEGSGFGGAELAGLGGFYAAKGAAGGTDLASLLPGLRLWAPPLPRDACDGSAMQVETAAAFPVETPVHAELGAEAAGAAAAQPMGAAQAPAGCQEQVASMAAAAEAAAPRDPAGRQRQWMSYNAECAEVRVRQLTTRWLERQAAWHAAKRNKRKAESLTPALDEVEGDTGGAMEGIPRLALPEPREGDWQLLGAEDEEGPGPAPPAATGVEGVVAGATAAAEEGMPMRRMEQELRRSSPIRQ
ncbi:ATPase family AAA domain-containing protein 5 [Tetrabaena socialis]|uniref:ATPase family AAA domain-containing protein 5 n=1 Tax=Tetrabaena socialis TaxID=47790 RepID=A0A2J7ZYE4_9CHLO|nr:ATPase family AAA domain-containing protein 5 [Tetrabaena socialis]|eukprot:PNH05280.1 ATPase family AAA domain-containing protein 5 [Tetrabaena socialis]